MVSLVALLSLMELSVGWGRTGVFSGAGLLGAECLSGRCGCCPAISSEVDCPGVGGVSGACGCCSVAMVSWSSVGLSRGVVSLWPVCSSLRS